METALNWDIRFQMGTNMCFMIISISKKTNAFSRLIMELAASELIFQSSRLLISWPVSRHRNIWSTIGEIEKVPSYSLWLQSAWIENCQDGHKFNVIHHAPFNRFLQCWFKWSPPLLIISFAYWTGDSCICAFRPFEFDMQKVPLPLATVLSGLHYNFSKFNGFPFCLLSKYPITSISSLIEVCKISYYGLIQIQLYKDNVHILFVV